MLIQRGIQASPGLAIGRAVVLDARDRPIRRRLVSPSNIESEMSRLKRAVEQSIAELESLRGRTAEALGDQLARIFDTHIGMLRDPYLITQFEQMIQERHVVAEFAVYDVMRRQARQYESIDNAYIRERAKDIWDLERRVLGHLIGEAAMNLAELPHEVVMIAHDLTPSQTAALDRTKIKAIATDLGGRTSHTAILAHALGIPAVVGLEKITKLVETDQTVIIDGNRGLVLVDPDAAQLLEYRQELQQIASAESAFGQAAQLPAETRDGTPVTILANIEFPSEIEHALNKGAVGIGLYRTEFLYLAGDSEPSEKDHYHAYCEAIRMLDGRPLTIRTLDLGADKMRANDMTNHPEPNPFLGCRSIRLCLQNVSLFKTQLRAILRASAEGPVRIMFPLISNVMELRQAKMILNDVREDLDEQGVAYADKIPIGIMIEVPSAALQAKVLAREADFFSIGTNDLIQYTVAADRSNERIASLYSGAHPAVLNLIKDVVRAAGRAKIEVSLCGEMGGEPEFVMLLLGFGLRMLSITPPAVPETKKIIRSVSIDQCKRIARKVAGFESDREVLNYLRQETSKIIPEMFRD